MPYPLVHDQFSVGRNRFEIDGQQANRAQQVLHLRALGEAVEVVRSYAPTSQEFRSLSALQKAELSEWGVEFLSHLSVTARRLAFRLTAFPGHLFYPYDKQWNED